MAATTLGGSLPAHQSPNPLKKAHNFDNAQHIKLDFELFRDGRQCMPSNEEQDVIFNLFPTSYRMLIHPPFLIIFCMNLPPKPWPVTVAGLPLFLTKDNDSPINYGPYSHGPKASVKSSISLWETPNLETFHEIFNVFRDLGADIRRLQWIGTGFLALAAKEPYKDWRSRLPWTVNHICIGYVFGQISAEEKAFRPDLSQEAACDKTAYDEQGLAFASKVSSPAPLPPISSETNSRTTSKIALAKPEAVNYWREMFRVDENTAAGFRKLLSVDNIQIGSRVFMDTLEYGLCEGVICILDVVRIANIPEQHASTSPTNYKIGMLVYHGNDGRKIHSGCHGRLVLNENDNIVGQFQLQVDDPTGLCYSLNLDSLARLCCKL